MDARQKSRVINKAYNYVKDNWIYTEPGIEKNKWLVDKIKKNDPDISDEDNQKLIELKKIFSDMENDPPITELNFPGFSFFKKNYIPSVLPELPAEMHKEIFNQLPFSEKQKFSLVSKDWNKFFNNGLIEKKYLFPKKSGGLIFFLEKQKIRVIRDLLSHMKDEVKKEIESELFNGLTIKNRREVMRLEDAQNNGIASYYLLFFLLILAALLSYEHGNYKTFASIMIFILMPPFVVTINASTINRLKLEPEKKQKMTEQYFDNLKHQA